MWNVLKLFIITYYEIIYDRWIAPSLLLLVCVPRSTGHISYFTLDRFRAFEKREEEK